MAFDYILSGAVTVLVTLYLAYALWRPERFQEMAMLFRFRREPFLQMLESSEACRGSTIILGMALAGGVIACAAMLISRIWAAPTLNPIFN